MTSTTADDDLCYTPATDLAISIRRRELSPVELVDALLRRIERVEPQVNSYVTVLADRARVHARRAEQAVVDLPAEELGALHGVPISIKDLTTTKGVRTTYGSRRFADHVPDDDTLLHQKVIAAGAILLGKTTTPEMGMGSTTESELTGTTHNPWRLDRTAGGSSGGAAAAVAAGISPLATGSDGGGSIRVPSAMCGVVGFKASSGRIPHSTEFEPYETVTVVGPITRTVADCALLTSVLAGYDHHQPFSLQDSPDFLAAVREPSAAGLRIAYSPDLGNGPVEREVTEALDAAVRAFQELGAEVEVVDISLPDPMTYFLDTWGPTVLADPASTEETFGDRFPAINQLRTWAERMSLGDYVRAQTSTRARIHRTFTDVLDRYDAMIWPTTKMVAHAHVGTDGGPDQVAGVPVVAPPGVSDFFARSVQNQLFTEAVSHAGLPAITVPAGFTSAGLPVGLQIATRQREDVAALRLAAAYEVARPWAQRRPQL